jgi:hypothetical protein
MSNQPVPQIESAPRVVWGARNIATAIGRSERAVFHMLEKDALPGAKRIGGRWCFDPTVFFATLAA